MNRLPVKSTYSTYTLSHIHQLLDKSNFYSWSTPGLLPVYSWSTPSLLPVYLRPTPGLLPVYSWSTPGLLPVYLRPTPSLLPVYLRPTPSLLPVYSRSTRGLHLTYRTGDTVQRQRVGQTDESSFVSIRRRLGCGPSPFPVVRAWTGLPPCCTPSL